MNNPMVIINSFNEKLNADPAAYKAACRELIALADQLANAPETDTLAAVPARARKAHLAIDKIAGKAGDLLRARQREKFEKARQEKQAPPPKTLNGERLLPLREAADLIGESVQYVRELIKYGLTHYSNGYRGQVFLLRRSDLDRELPMLKKAISARKRPVYVPRPIDLKKLPKSQVDNR